MIREIKFRVICISNKVEDIIISLLDKYKNKEKRGYYNEF